MKYCKKNLGKPDPDYGGVLTDISTLPVGTEFFVCNGCWHAEIVDLGNGATGIGFPTWSGNPRFSHIQRINRDDCSENILALSDIRFPEDYAAGRKTISLHNGKYTVVYDPTGAYPEQYLRHGKPWRDLTGDNLIFWLCAELEKTGAAKDQAVEGEKARYQVYEDGVTYLLEIDHAAKIFSLGSVDGSVKAPGYTTVDITAYMEQIRRIGTGYRAQQQS